MQSFGAEAVCTVHICMISRYNHNRLQLKYNLRYDTSLGCILVTSANISNNAIIKLHERQCQVVAVVIAEII